MLFFISNCSIIILGDRMKIGIAADHDGVKVKKNIKKYLEHLGNEVIDYGTNSNEIVDFPDYAFKVGKAINNEIELGILICGTGIGMSMAANKVNGVRCALIHNVKDAKLAKEHNNANCLALSANFSMFRIKDMLDAFMKAKFSDVERYHRRADILDNYR